METTVAREATYADLEAVPPHLVAEILDGKLFTHPRPAPRHGAAATALSAELTGPFQRGRGGPGGWVFIVEPELHLGRNVVVPDIAAWCTNRMTAIPETAWIDLVPDWICEVLSPSTASLDRGRKRRIYAKAGLQHLWLLEPIEEQLEVFELSNGKWLLFDTFENDAEVAAPPFKVAPFPLTVLWPFKTTNKAAPPTRASDV